MDDENEPTKKVILQNDTFAIFVFFDMKSQELVDKIENLFIKEYKQHI